MWVIIVILLHIKFKRPNNRFSTNSKNSFPTKKAQQNKKNEIRYRTYLSYSFFFTLRAHILYVHSLIYSIIQITVTGIPGIRLITYVDLTFKIGKKITTILKEHGMDDDDDDGKTRFKKKK